MTFHALAVFLISWVVPPSSPQPPLDGGLPRWERHPAEQRHLREEERRRTDLWSRIPRSW